MFGYVKTDVPSLRVRENELYRAIYCGLCRAMGSVTGQLSRFSLSYDFAFLAAVRLLAEEEVPAIRRGRCLAHPVKKRAFVADCHAVEFTAVCSAVLFFGKIEDDIADEGFLRATVSRLLLPTARGAIKRAARRERELTDELTNAVHEHLCRLSEIESEDVPSLDAAAREFGELTGELFATGLSESSSRICREIGRAVGAFIYICDAADDAAEDFKRGRKNPIIAADGENALCERDGKTCLVPNVARRVFTCAAMYLSECESAAELLCDNAPREMRDVAEIVRNTLYSGLVAELRRILKISDEEFALPE